MTLLLANARVGTIDGVGTEHEDGWVLVSDGLVAAVDGGAPPEADERIDLRGALVTPGLVNTHHHLYQTLTPARAQQADLFTWAAGCTRAGVRIVAARGSMDLGESDGGLPPTSSPRISTPCSARRSGSPRSRTGMPSTSRRPRARPSP